MTMDSVNSLSTDPCHTAFKDLSHCAGNADTSEALRGMLKMSDLCTECRLAYLEGTVACKMPFLKEDESWEPMITDMCSEACQSGLMASAEACDHITLDDRRLATLTEIKQKLSNHRRL